MFKRPLIVGILLLAGILSAAEKLDSLSVGTRTYRDVTVIGANETDLYFTHAEGIANVKLRNLSPELQKRFHFDPKVATETENRRIQEDSMFQKSIAEKAAAQATHAAAAKTPVRKSSEASLADPISDTSLLDKPAPELKFENWTSDPPPLGERAVLVYFYAPWSIPCRKASERITALRKKFSETVSVVGVLAIGGNGTEGENESKADLPSALDPDAKLAKAFGVTSVPSVVFVDSRNIVRYIGHPAALSDDGLEKLLAAASE